MTERCRGSTSTWEPCERSIQFQNHPNFYAHEQIWRAVASSVDEGLSLVEAIALAVDPRLAVRLRLSDRWVTLLHKRDACRELRGAILSRQAASEILGPQGPQLAAAQLHPWVWNHAARLWSDGHRRAAVQAAAAALFDSQIPARLGRQLDTSGGVDLMGQAFSI